MARKCKYTETFRQLHAANLHKSNLSVQEYSRLNNIKPNTLSTWLKRYEPEMNPLYVTTEDNEFLKLELKRLIKENHALRMENQNIDFENNEISRLLSKVKNIENFKETKLIPYLKMQP